MGKVIIERPRSGSRSARSAKARDYGKVIQTEEDGYDYEGLTHLPVSRKQEGYNKKLGDKSFTDVLGPFHNFLYSSVGRLWDDVYSDIAQVLGKAGWGVRHILTQHLDVEVNAILEDGKILAIAYEHGYREIGAGELYVHPETRRLEKYPGNKRAYRNRKKRPSNYDWLLVPCNGKADSDFYYVNIDGIWFIGEYVEVLTAYSVTKNKYSATGEIRHYIEPKFPDLNPDMRMYASAKTLRFIKTKSCSKKEIKTCLKIRAGILAKKYPKWWKQCEEKNGEN